MVICLCEWDMLNVQFTLLHLFYIFENYDENYDLPFVLFSYVATCASYVEEIKWLTYTAIKLDSFFFPEKLDSFWILHVLFTDLNVFLTTIPLKSYDFDPLTKK